MCAMTWHVLWTRRQDEHWWVCTSIGSEELKKHSFTLSCSEVEAWPMGLQSSTLVNQPCTPIRLIGRLIGWKLHWLVGWIVWGQSLAHGFTIQCIGQLATKSHRVDWPVDWVTNCTDWLVGLYEVKAWPMDLPSSMLANQPWTPIRLIERLVGWQIASSRRLECMASLLFFWIWWFITLLVKWMSSVVFGAVVVDLFSLITWCI